MYRRLTTWSALGLINNLATIPEQRLEEAIAKSKMLDDVFLDTSLAGLLSNLSKIEFGMLMGMKVDEFHHLPLPSLQQLTKLGTDGYCKATSKHFHYFCIRLLVVFGHRMAEFCKVARAKASRDRVTGDAFTLIPFIRALLLVAHSNALSRHFEILTESRDLLPLPSVNLEAEYVKFAVKHKILPSSTVRDQKVAPGKAVEGMVEDASVGDGDVDELGEGLVEMTHLATSHIRSGNTEDQAHVQVGEGDTDGLGEELGEESFEMARSATTSHTGEMFRRWFKSFVSHFAAKRALELHSSRTISKGGHIRIHILGTNRPTPDPGSWGEVTGLINKLVNEMQDPHKPKLKAEAIIASIKSHLSEYDKSAHPQSYHKVYEQFQYLLDKEKPGAFNHEEVPLFPRCQHCEAILAAAAQYHRAMAPENQDLMDILQVHMLLAAFNHPLNLQFRSWTTRRFPCPDCVALCVGTY